MRHRSLAQTLALGLRRQLARVVFVQLISSGGARVGAILGGCLWQRTGNLQGLKVLQYAGLNGGLLWRKRLCRYYRSRIAQTVSVFLDFLPMLSDVWISGTILASGCVDLFGGWLSRPVVALSRRRLLLLQHTEACSGGKAVLRGCCGKDLQRRRLNLRERRLEPVVALLWDVDRLSGVVHAERSLLAELQWRRGERERLHGRLQALMRNGELLSVKCWYGAALVAVELLQPAAGSLALIQAFRCMRVTGCCCDHLLLHLSLKALLTRARAVLTG